MIKIVARDIFLGDAVGNFALDTNKAFLENGIASCLYATNYAEGNLVKPLSDLNVNVGKDVLVYNFSIGDPDFDTIRSFDCKKVCYFHGITPPAFFRQIEPEVSLNCNLGIKQISGLAVFDTIFCNSRLSEAQLRANGLSREAIVSPPVILNERFKTLLSFSKNKKPNSDLLVVGRLAPHKNVDIVIDIADSLSSAGWTGLLHIVGAPLDGQVGRCLQERASNMEDQSRVIFHGHVTDDVLLSLYKSSAVLISASDHEGFFVPGLEGICAGLSVVIKRGTGSEEIFGRQAFLFSDLSEAVDCINGILSNATQESQVSTGFTSSLFEKSSEFLDRVMAMHDRLDQM